MINIKNEPKPVHAANAAISYKLPEVGGLYCKICSVGVVIWIRINTVNLKI